MPHIAELGRTEPLRDADRAQLEQTCIRITNGKEFLYGAKLIRRDWRHLVRSSKAMFDAASNMRCDTAAQQALCVYLPPEHGFHNMARGR